MTAYSTFATFLDRLDDRRVLEAGVVRWACPVPYFGRCSSARIATVGINPSVREFASSTGSELTGEARRFPTLRSLELPSWRHADATHVKAIAQACSQYFSGNPYRRWFGVLEALVGHAECSYYGSAPTACHVDLVPYATLEKWGDLAGWQRRELLISFAGLLGQQLAHTSIEILILNGRSVVDHFSDISDVTFSTIETDDWQLANGTSRRVRGVAYAGRAKKVGGTALEHPITIVGFNHNLQSSFGVTRAAVNAIGRWLSNVVANHRM